MIDFPIIDSHIHLFNQQRFTYSWAKGAPTFARDWTPDDLAACAKPYVVEGFVFSIRTIVGWAEKIHQCWLVHMILQDPHIDRSHSDLSHRLKEEVSQFQMNRNSRSFRRPVCALACRCRGS